MSDLLTKIHQLQANLRRLEPELLQLRADLDSHWATPDLIYRFYHHSFKVSGLQSLTQRIVDLLREVMPGVELNDDFVRIREEGQPGGFTQQWNADWHEKPRRILEAFFHARYFLDMAIVVAKEPDLKENEFLSSHLAGFLYLFNMR
jgi:hypothetical protein